MWYSPTKEATDVYGLMFNVFPKMTNSHSNSIYGIELNISPIGFFVPFVTAIHSIDPETHQVINTDVNEINFAKYKKIYGLQIGIANLEPSVIYGLDISLSGSFESKTNGATISLVMNKHDIINGLTIAAIGNHDTYCRGVQIGLINTCRDLRGFQIGIWNKNQKRALPIINWCFSSKK